VTQAQGAVPAAQPPFEVRHRNPVNLLRGVAVVAVVVHHLAVYEGSAVPYLSVVGGQLGVQLFFLISGYLLVQSADRRRWAPFLAGRAVRILPCYWVALCAAAWMLGRPLVPAGADEVLDYLASVFALGHLRPYGLYRFDSLFVSWTLTIEWTWYLGLPLLAWAAARSGRPVRFWCAAALAAAVLSHLWVMAAQAGRLDGVYAEPFRRITADPAALDALRVAFVTVAAPAQWTYFLIGALMRVAQDRVASIPVWAAVLVALVLLGDPARTAALSGTDPTVATGIGLAGLFVLALRVPAGARWLLPLHRLGDLSYPLYLLHVPVTMAIVQRVAPGARLARRGPRAIIDVPTNPRGDR